MQTVLMILVVLAALVTIVSGVWVAVALMAAIGRARPRDATPTDEAAASR
jgi:uncharacterized protein YneF (UPF0154 family)